MIKIILYIFISIFSLISIISFFIFFINFKKNRLIYKSIFSSLFKSFSSILIIIVFYFCTFSLVGAFNSYSNSIEKNLETLIIDNHVHQIDFTEIELEEIERNQSYENLFNFSVSLIDADNSYSITTNLISDNDLVDEYNNFFLEELSLDNFWGDYGYYYFGTIENFISFLIYRTTVENFNNYLQEIGKDFEIVFNFYPFNVYSPIISQSLNEVYFLMGYNSINLDGYNHLFRYSGEEGNYIIDNFVVNEYATNYDGQSVKESLSKKGSEFNEDGSKENPYKIVIQQEYVDENNIDIKKDNAFEKNGYYFEIMATGHFSNIIFPIYSLNNFITDFSQQAAVLMNVNALSEIAPGNQDFVFNMGFTDVYDEASKSDIYYYSNLYDYKNESILKERSNYIRKYIYNNTRTGGFFSNDTIYISDNGIITGENISFEAFRAYGAVDEIKSEKTLLNFFMYVFLIIIVFVLILLIQKRVKDYAKQFGTFKSLGLNSNQASVAFLVYPMFIIAISGFIALLLSIPLQYFLLGIFSSFFSMPTLTLTFTFSSFFYVIIFPALILFASATIVSKLILNKPPIELLSNKVNDEPNFIVLKTGKFVPKNASFGFAYKFKGLTKAWGKSLLLIVSVFLATALTALAFSTRNVFTDLESSISTNVNYNYASFTQNTKFDYDTYDINSFSYKEEADPIYPEELLIDELDINSFNSAQEAYDYLGDYLLYDSNDEYLLDFEIVSNDKMQYYIPKEAIWNYYYLIWIIFQEDSNFDLNQNFDGEQYSANDFMRLADYVKLDIEFLISKSEKTNGDLVNWIFEDQMFNREHFNLLVSHSSDLIFRDIYYDSAFQTATSYASLTMRTSGENAGPNNKNNYFMNIFEDPSYINNVYSVPEESVEKLNEELDNLGDDNLDYIPVVVDSFTFNYLLLTSPQIFTYDPLTDSYYGENISYSNNYSNSKSDVNIKVVDVYQSFFATGFTTVNDFIETYNWTDEDDFSNLLYNGIFWSLPDDYSLSDTSTVRSLTLVLENQYINQNNGENITYEEYINNSKTLLNSPTSEETLESQTDTLFAIVNGFLIVISTFALIVAIIITVIAMKDVNDKSDREVAMLKALGYSNKKATSLVLTPYAIIIFFGFIISIPFAFLILFLISNVLTNLTGSAYTFSLTIFQWIILLIFIILLITFLGIVSYRHFKKTNPLDAIKDTE